MGRAGPAGPGVRLSVVSGPCGRPTPRPGIAASRRAVPSRGIVPSRGAVPSRSPDRALALGRALARDRTVHGGRFVVRAGGAGPAAHVPPRAVAPAGAVLLGRPVLPGGVPGRGRPRRVGGAVACRRVPVRRPVRPSRALAGGDLAGGDLAGRTLLSDRLVRGKLLCRKLLGRDLLGRDLLGRDLLGRKLLGCACSAANCSAADCSAAACPGGSPRWAGMMRTWDWSAAGAVRGPDSNPSGSRAAGMAGLTGRPQLPQNASPAKRPSPHPTHFSHIGQSFARSGIIGHVARPFCRATCNLPTLRIGKPIMVE